MKKWLLLLLFVVIVLTAAIALHKRTPGQQPPDKNAITNKPARIVSTAPNLTEILFALGLADKIVGVPLHSNYPPAATDKPKIGTFWEPNIEAVIDTKPQLVVTLAFTQQKNLAQHLSRMGYNTLMVDIDKVDDFFQALETIGAATATEAKAAKLAADLRQNLIRLSELTKPLEKIKVLWVIQREPLRVAGTDTFINEMIELAGGTNAIGRTVHKYPPIGAEQVYACAPDVIIEPSVLKEDLPTQRDTAMQYWQKFQAVPAVRNQRVYVIDGDIVSRLGPRLYEAVETIAKCLRPDLIIEPAQ